MNKSYVRVNGDNISHVLSTWDKSDENVFEIQYIPKAYEHYYLKIGKYSYDIDRANKIVKASPVYEDLPLEKARHVFNEVLERMLKPELDFYKSVCLENGAIIEVTDQNIATLSLMMEFIRSGAGNSVLIKAANGYFNCDGANLLDAIIKIVSNINKINGINHNIDKIVRKPESIEDLINLENSIKERGPIEFFNDIQMETGR